MYHLTCGIEEAINFNIARIWVDFGTGKPISATTGCIFMRLGNNMPQIS